MASFLKPDKTIALTVGGKTLTVNQKIIPDDLRASKDVASYVRKGQPMKPCAPFSTGKPLGICVHNTNMIKVAAGTNAAEQYTRATYNENMLGVVVHYYVWRDEIWQLLRLDERGWHAGDGSKRRAGRRPGQTVNGNRDTIAIEAIGPDAATTDTTALLCAWLCRELRLDPALDIWQHFDFSGKNCPEYIRPRWGQFIAAVQGYLSGVESDTSKPKNPAQRPTGAKRGDLKEGDRVRVINSGVPYCPGAKDIPAWLTKREHITIDRVGEKAGKPAVLLGEDIQSWILKEYVEKVEDTQ